MSVRQDNCMDCDEKKEKETCVRGWMSINEFRRQADRMEEREREKARQIDQWWSSMTSLTFVFMKMPNRSFSIKSPFVEINERIISWYGSRRNKMEAYGLRVNVEVDVHRSTSFAWEESQYVFSVQFTIDEWQRQVKVKNDCFHLISRWSRDWMACAQIYFTLNIHTPRRVSRLVKKRCEWTSSINIELDFIDIVFHSIVFIVDTWGERWSRSMNNSSSGMFKE